MLVRRHLTTVIQRKSVTLDQSQQQSILRLSETLGVDERYCTEIFLAAEKQANSRDDPLYLAVGL